MTKKIFTSVALAAMLTATTVIASASNYTPSVVSNGGVKPAASTCVGKDTLGAETTVSLVGPGETGTTSWYLQITPFDAADSGMGSVYQALTASADLKDFASKVDGVDADALDGYQVVALYDASIIGTKPADVTVTYSLIVDGIKSGDEAKVLHFSETGASLKADDLGNAVKSDNTLEVVQKDFSPVLILKKTNPNPAQPTGAPMNYGGLMLVSVALVSSAAFVVVYRKRRTDAE
ncbi:MAG: hypothetical protein J5825_03980 [Lachnospiraceae bacterium]|nr:hypothetical protein [Lachnospiraceae bacterium]